MCEVTCIQGVLVLTSNSPVIFSNIDGIKRSCMIRVDKYEYQQKRIFLLHYFLTRYETRWVVWRERERTLDMKLQFRVFMCLENIDPRNVIRCCTELTITN